RILSITAGAAGMYCGSCFRDNALAAELLARGHDVTLLPLYTPTRTDEPNVSARRVLFGGVSVYLQQHSALFRKTPRVLDGIPASRMAVVPLGIPMNGYERRHDEGGTFTVGYFARISPEKGLHVLADAYVRLRRRTGRAPMRLEAAGYMASNQAAYLGDVRRQ